MNADERGRFEDNDARNFRRLTIELPDSKTGTILSLVPWFSHSESQLYVVQVAGERWVRHVEGPI